MAAAGLGGPVALIGVGLIGGSLGLALREAGVADIRGVDPADGAVEDALARGAITRACTDVADAVAGARVVVVCAPVGDIPEVVRVALRAADDEAVVTDVGSAKSMVLAALTPAERERFCGGHPVAGGERSGVANARADLFTGATWSSPPRARRDRNCCAASTAWCPRWGRPPWRWMPGCTTTSWRSCHTCRT